MDKLQNQKVIKIWLLTAVLGLLLGWAVLVWNETRIRQLNAEDVVTDSLDEGYGYYIDYLNYEGNLIVEGWFAKIGEDIRNVSIKFVLRNIRTGRCYMIPTTMKIRKDVTAYYKDGHDYDNSGFSINIPPDKRVQNNGNDYEMLILYGLNNSEKLISLGASLKTWEGQK